MWALREPRCWGRGWMGSKGGGWGGAQMEEMVVLLGYSVDLMQEPRGRYRRFIWPAGQTTLREPLSLAQNGP